MLEGNSITIAGRKCTIEFQPSADMCWQSWANNEIDKLSPRYPSPYANVHSGKNCLFTLTPADFTVKCKHFVTVWLRDFFKKIVIMSSNIQNQKFFY